MAQFDANHDSKVDAQDAIFQELKVWRDANGDGVSQASELLSLQDLGIASFNLSAAQGIAVENGNTFGLVSSYTTTDGAVHELTDVWFAQGAQTLLSTDASGVTTLKMASSDQSLDLTAVGTGKLQGLDVIDLTGAGVNKLSLDLSQVLDLSGVNVFNTGNSTAKQLAVLGDAQDMLQIGAGWTNSGMVLNYAGHDLAVYDNSTGEAQLLIEQVMLNAHHVMM